MPKQFFTEKDIEDLVKRGVFSLELTDDDVLTELAYEKANRLGLKLIRDKADSPPSAPVRPYISEKTAKKPGSSSNGAPTGAPTFSAPGAPARSQSDGSRMSTGQPPTMQTGTRQDAPDLHQRIRNAVVARLGSQIDPNLLDTIIRRVMNSTGVK